MKNRWLELQLMAARLGVLHLAWSVLGLTLAALAFFGARQSWKAEALERELLNPALRPMGASEPKPMAGSVVHTGQARLEAFRAQLGGSENVERHLQTIFDKAGAQGLTLAEGRYQVAENAAGSYQTIRVELPVTGPYPAVRRFAEETLLAMPHAALESIQFRRESTRDTEIKAQLNFSLYLDSRTLLQGQDVRRPAAK